jgi:hypothetical protein
VPLALLVGMILQSGAADIVLASSFSYVGEQQWVFPIHRSDLEQAPRWLETVDEPPLAPTRAILTAREVLERWMSNGFDWRLGQVKLMSVSKPEWWIYVIEFLEPLPAPKPYPTLGSFMPASMSIPVLMNGHSVEPTRRPWPEQQPHSSR